MSFEVSNKVPTPRDLRRLHPDEIYNLPVGEMIAAIREDRRIERKEPGISARSLSEWFSMWANTPPDGGIIAVGVKDSGAVCGVLAKSVDHLNDLERTGPVFCPDVRYDVRSVAVENLDGEADQILVFRVFYNRDKVVCTNQGRAYIRRGGSKTEIQREEVRELQIEKGEVSFEQEDSVLNYPEDYNMGAIAAFCSAVIARQNLEHTSEKEEILRIRMLGRLSGEKFIPNKACSLLFSRNPRREFPGAQVRFLRFDGKDEGVGMKYNAIKDEFIEGTIPDVIYKVAAILRSQLREFSRLNPADGKFYTSQEYPETAWYEAVVNACSHRSYNLKNASVFIRMFDDRLEFESPGGFMPFVTPQNIYDQHMPRNPEIMRSLFYLDFVKCAHEGTRRMKRTMLENDLPAPEFTQRDDGNHWVKVVLRNNVEHRKVWLDSHAKGLVGEVAFAKLNEHEIRIINYAAEFRRVTVSDVQRITGKSWPASRKLLEGLDAKEILREVRRPNMVRDIKAFFMLRRPI